MHRLSEAEPLYREAVEIGRRKLGEHPDVALWQSNLASVLAEKGDIAAAERLYEPSLALCREKLGPGSVREAYILSGMGQMHLRARKYADATADLEQALAIRRQTIGPGHPDTADSLFQLALVRRAQGQLPEAESLAREAVRIDRIRPQGIPASAHLLGLAQILMDRHDARDAEPLAQKSLDLRAAAMPADSWQVKEARERLAEIRHSLAAQ